MSFLLWLINIILLYICSVLFMLTWFLGCCPSIEYWVLVSASGMFIWGLVSEPWIIFSNFWMKAFHCQSKIVVLIQPCPSATGISFPWSWGLAFAKETVKLWRVHRSKTWAIKCSFGAVPAAEQMLTSIGEGRAAPPLCFGCWRSGKGSHQSGCRGHHFSLGMFSLIF